MGYTHYWRKPTEPIDPLFWREARNDCLMLISAARTSTIAPLEVETDDNATYVNGMGDDEYETFVLPRDPDDLEEFNFCKTAQKPYDVVVTACLCRLAETGLLVSSDGWRNEWHEGQQMMSKFLRRIIPVPASVEARPG